MWLRSDLEKAKFEVTELWQDLLVDTHLTSIENVVKAIIAAIDKEDVQTVINGINFELQIFSRSWGLPSTIQWTLHSDKTKYVIKWSPGYPLDD